MVSRRRAGLDRPNVDVVAALPGWMQIYPLRFGQIHENSRHKPGFASVDLLVPEKHHPSTRLKDQVYTWREGESVLFDDSWKHEVYNNCDQDP